MIESLLNAQIRLAHLLALVEQDVSGITAEARFTPKSLKRADIERALDAMLDEALDILTVKVGELYDLVESVLVHELRSALPRVTIESISREQEGRGRKRAKQLLSDSNIASEHSLIAGPSGRSRARKALLRVISETLLRERDRGTSELSIIRLLSDTVGSRRFWYPVTRTELIRAYGAAALDVAFRNRDVVAGLQWSATMDSRTCPICFGLDGTRWYFDPLPGQSGMQDRKVPPAHRMCRCVLLLILRARHDIAARTRVEENWIHSSLDGSPPPILSYDEWLRRQPKEVQAAALGEERHTAFLKGVTVDRFSAEGRELSLDAVLASKGELVKSKAVRAKASSESASGLSEILGLPVVVIPRMPLFLTSKLGAWALQHSLGGQTRLVLGDFVGEYLSSYPPFDFSPMETTRWALDRAAQLGVSPWILVSQEVGKLLTDWRPISLGVYDTEEGCVLVPGSTDVSGVKVYAHPAMMSRVLDPASRLAASRFGEAPTARAGSAFQFKGEWVLL